MADWGLIPTGPMSREYGDAAETRAKLGALREAMQAAGADAVYLESWANVAWLCGGRGNRVVLDSPAGLCAVLLTANGAWLLVPNNEEARCRDEAFAGLALPLVSRPWYRLPLWQSAASLLPDGAVWAADVPVPGAGDAEPILAMLRRRLTEPEMMRYRALGADSAEALETALLEILPGWTEIEAAGTISAALKAREIESKVVLVGGRARAERFRHLVPTASEVADGLMASVTAVRHGLHASLTRCLSFGEPPPQLMEKHATVISVDRAYLSLSRPGESLGTALTAGETAYTEGGFYDEWKEHHQGGTTGYAGREVFAQPGVDYVIDAGMAVAWNPTVPGAKSEDTFLIRDEGLELLTAWPGTAWPSAEAAGIPRSGILIRWWN